MTQLLGKEGKDVVAPSLGKRNCALKGSRTKWNGLWGLLSSLGRSGGISPPVAAAALLLLNTCKSKGQPRLGSGQMGNANT